MSYTVIQPSGVLDGPYTGQICQEIDNILTDGIQTILVDFQQVTFMNSFGISALVSSLESVNAGGAELFLCSLNDQIKLIFELTRMDQTFTICCDREAFEREMLAAC